MIGEIELHFGIIIRVSTLQINIWKSVTLIPSYDDACLLLG